MDLKPLLATPLNWLHGACGFAAVVLLAGSVLCGAVPDLEPYAASTRVAGLYALAAYLVTAIPCWFLQPPRPAPAEPIPAPPPDVPIAPPTNRTFVFDPRHLAFADGKAERPDHPVYWGQGLLLLAFMTPFLWSSATQLNAIYHSSAIRMHLAEDGRAGQATVIERREIPHDEGAPTYVLRFTFAPPGGSPAEFERSVAQGTFDGTRMGGPLPVLYSPSHPEAVLPADNDGWGPVARKVLFALVWNAICLPMVGWLLWRLWFDLRIRHAARLRRGKLVGITPDEDGDGDFVVKVAYTFQDHEGRTLDATWSGPCKALEGQPLPAVGTPIAVAYADRRTYLLL